VIQLVQFPALQLVTPGSEIPPGNPAPGTPLGGGLPSQASAEVLNLVPSGLNPVATFPPFANPRTIPADAVIFSENPQTLAAGRRRRRKRSLMSRFRRLFTRQGIRTILSGREIRRLFTGLQIRRNWNNGTKVLFFYADSCLTFELLLFLTSNVILFECQLFNDIKV
jgi:hypothetical protein